MVIVFIIVIVIGIFYFLIYLLLRYYVHLIDIKAIGGGSQNFFLF